MLEEKQIRNINDKTRVKLSIVAEMRNKEKNNIVILKIIK